MAKPLSQQSPSVMQAARARPRAFTRTRARTVLLFVKIAVLSPTSCPAELTSAPPLLTALTLASVCTRSARIGQAGHMKPEEAQRVNLRAAKLTEQMQDAWANLKAGAAAGGEPWPSSSAHTHCGQSLNRQAHLNDPINAVACGRWDGALQPADDACGPGAGWRACKKGKQGGAGHGAGAGGARVGKQWHARPDYPLWELPHLRSWTCPHRSAPQLHTLSGRSGSVRAIARQREAGCR
jgi:hypothetical protein